MQLLTIVLSCCLVANYSQVTVPLLCEILAATQQAQDCPFLQPGGQLFSGDGLFHFYEKS
jgi:hypothetical protein